MAEKICPGDSLVGNIWIKLANNGVKLFCPTIMLLADSYRHVNETHCEKGWRPNPTVALTVLERVCKQYSMVSQNKEKV